MTTPPLPPTPESQPGFEQVIVPPAPQPAGSYPPAPSNVYPQQGYPPPATSGSGNTVVKIVLIVVGIIVLFGAIAAAVVGYGVYRVSKAVHRASTGDVSFSTPGGGSISTGSGTNISSSDLGIPNYPGAKSAAGSMKMKTPAGTLITAAFTTSDSSEQVVNFYKEKMGEQASVIEGGGSTILTSGENQSDKLVVTITPQESLTKITIMHTRNLRQ